MPDDTTRITNLQTGDVDGIESTRFLYQRINSNEYGECHQLSKSTGRSFIYEP